VRRETEVAQRQRQRAKTIRPSGEIKVDFLIPVFQDLTEREHPHTAYAEWARLLLLNIDNMPTYGGRQRGPEGGSTDDEDSDHWWVSIPRGQLQTLLRLLRDEAPRIFHQRWIIAWTGKTVYKLGDTVGTKRR
jgi:hypothetical protein